MPQLALLHTADNMSMAIADDLLCCDWLGRIRLIITWAVHHLAIATLGMIDGDAFRSVWSASNVSRYLSNVCLWSQLWIVQKRINQSKYDWTQVDRTNHYQMGVHTIIRWGPNLPMERGTTHIGKQTQLGMPAVNKLNVICTRQQHAQCSHSLTIMQ